MKYLFGLLFSIFLATLVVKAQQPIINGNDKIVDSIETELIAINISVVSSNKGYLKNLTSKNFEIYNKKTSLSIKFVYFDEQKQQYIVVFYPEGFALNFNWREVKVKIKLTAKEKKEYGKTLVNRQN